MPMPNLELGKELFINMYICTRTYTCEKLFSKTQSLNLVLALQANFPEWRLARFGKELFIFCKSCLGNKHGQVCLCGVAINAIQSPWLSLVT